MGSRLRAIVGVGLLLVLAYGHARTDAQSTEAITSPRQQFGSGIGDDYFLATLSQFEAYWTTLDEESERMMLIDIGRTEEGRTQWMAVVTAPENFQKLDRYREIARRLALAEGLGEDEARALAEEGKAIVWISGGLHADEVLGAQQLIETVYRLVSRNDMETLRVLRDVIVLAVHANPDGHELVANWYMREPDSLKRTTVGVPRLYQKYIGHDNNRDFYMATQAETINMNRILYREWFPQIVYDHHQSGPDGTVMFAPPFRGPFNYVFDPLIPAGIELLGAAMHNRFAAEGKPGVTMRNGANYSSWWNGGLRTTAYFHNQIGLLTETIGHPTPMEVPYVRARQVPSPELPNPIAPQTWYFRQSIEYSVTANRAVLDAASRYRQTLLLNAYRMGRNAIDRGSRDSWTARPRRPLGRLRELALRDPRGYILPADQPDFLTATKFVNALLSTGVDVHRAEAAFTVGGRRYPAGSYVVKTAQAFRPHVLDMFEAQEYPAVVPHPGGAPQPPYDSAGWTLAFQMGVRFDRILDPFDGPFEKVAGIARPPAGLVTEPPGTVGYLVSHHQNDTFVAVNRLVQAGEEVYWLRDRSVGRNGVPATDVKGGGMMYVAAKSSTPPILRSAATDLGLTISGVSRAPPGDALKLHPISIGLADREGGSIASGWVRWLLERYEFPFEVVDPPGLDGTTLAAGYDVVILPHDTIARGSEARAATRLKPFVEAGGTLVAIGSSTSLASAFGLPITNPLVERQADGSTGPLPSDAFSVPGSVLRVRVDNTLPLAYGFEREVDLFFDSSPVFRLDADAPSRGIRPVAWFATGTPLRSGWARGQAYLKDAVVVVEAALGKGRILLFGPDITFRAQAHGTFKFLFNGIYYGSATPANIN